jgi:hypothetical protein
MGTNTKQMGLMDLKKSREESTNEGVSIVMSCLIIKLYLWRDYATRIYTHIHIWNSHMGIVWEQRPPN